MHNLKDIRKNLDLFKKKILDRGAKIDFEKLIILDIKNRDLIQKKESLEQEKKILSKNKDQGNFEKSKNLSKQLDEFFSQHEKIQIEIDTILSNIPNIALPDVPIGADENFNKLIRKEGNVRNFSFNIRSHSELGEISDGIDFKSSIKLSGSRFVVLKDKYALLERALINFMLDTHTNRHEYKEISPPLIVNEEVMFGTGQLPKFEDDQFELKLESSSKRKFLIPTAEVVLTNLFRESNIEYKNLPLRFVSATPCFRKEAGSYGKDTKGMIRQHQFYKVEMVSIVESDKSMLELDRMTNCATNILDMLKLPYRKIILCTGDMGFSAEKTFDIEVWLPSENKYREISSCSSCGSFQARRMKARYKNDKKETVFVGTLNGSGLAVGRTLVAILENYQQEDGSIIVPEVLKPYMNNIEKINKI